MDVRVSVEGVAREVCGVSSSTTCEEMIIKLAQAANLPGFYTLVAIYRGHEDTLSADEKMYDFFRKIGTKPSHVQFELRRLEEPSPRPSQSNTSRRGPQPSFTGRPDGRSTSRQAHSTSNEPDMTDYSLDGDVRSPRMTVSNWPSSSTAHHSNRPSGHHYHQQQPSGSRRQIASNEPNQKMPHNTTQANTTSDLDEYEQLQDQLAYQEQEVELNRIRLLQLDKEIADSEHATRSLANTDLALDVGPAAELAHLAATPWPQLIDANKTRQSELTQERERYQLSLDRVTGQLEKTQSEALQLETRVSQDMDSLLSTLDTANSQRRQLLRSLSPIPLQTRPSLVMKSSGVPV